MKPKKSLMKMKGKNGILLFVKFLKGLLEDRKEKDKNVPNKKVGKGVRINPQKIGAFLSDE